MRHWRGVLEQDGNVEAHVVEDTLGRMLLTRLQRHQKEFQSLQSSLHGRPRPLFQAAHWTCEGSTSPMSPKDVGGRFLQWVSLLRENFKEVFRSNSPPRATPCSFQGLP